MREEIPQSDFDTAGYFRHKSSAPMSLIKYLLLLVCVFLSGCRPAGPRPVMLTLDVHSYDSPQAVMQSLAVKPVDWKVIENNRTGPSDKRPPYHLLVVSVENVMDHGALGTARLHFFNNRLSRVSFYPKDFAYYKRKLRTDLDIELDSPALNLRFGARIRSGKDYKRRAVC